MQCKKCGTFLLESDKFCKNCGEKVPEISSQENNTNYQQNNIQPSSNNFFGDNGNNNLINTPTSNEVIVNTNSTNTTTKNNTSKKLISLILIVGAMVIVGAIILFIVAFSLLSSNSNKLVCKSNEGNITILYNDKELTGYKASGMGYDFDGQKEYAKQVGIDAYIKEFNEWFTSNTSGSCTISQENNNNSDSSTITVGNDKYGYITIPNNWVTFYDVEDNDSLQYSYGGIYIVSLNYFEDNQYSAKEYATNYMYNRQNSSDVTGVTGATVTIGKNKEYTAYQIYMYYPADSTYLVTYWFEAEDGKTHYIALEGPEQITDYTFIPESFSLKKNN